MHYRVLSVSFMVGCSQHYVSAPDKTSSDWSSLQPTGIVIIAKETGHDDREGSQRSGLELRCLVKYSTP